MSAPTPTSRETASARRSPAVALLLLVAALPHVGCAGGDAIATGVNDVVDAGNGAPCKKDSDCAATDSNGVKLVCGFDPSGASVCVETCSDPLGASVSYGKPDSYACFEGRQTPCEQLPAATTCGCGCGAGTYCLASGDGATVSCVPAFAPGSACAGGAMCTSGMCCADAECGDLLPSQGTCSVPLGDPCTGSSDCPSCFVSISGQPLWCSLSCSVTTTYSGLYSTNCPNNFACLGGGGATEGFCYEECSGSGAATCPTGTTCKPYEIASGAIGTGYACQ